MVPRQFLWILVLALPVLAVAFGVVMGGYALSVGVSDSPGARGLWWTGIGLLMTLIVDLVLLVGVLGLKTLADAERPRRDEP